MSFGLVHELRPKDNATSLLLTKDPSKTQTSLLFAAVGFRGIVEHSHESLDDTAKLSRHQSLDGNAAESKSARGWSREHISDCALKNAHGTLDLD